MSFEGRTGVVTGGAQGIGKAVAAAFLRQGMRVVIADVDEEAGRETVEELAGEVDVSFIRADVSREDDVRNIAAEVRERYGSLDVLVNNAGIFVDTRIPVEDLSLEDWNRVLGVNLTGAFLCAKHCAPLLRQAKGSIVNIASTRALMSEANTEPYSASKGGITALTHALAVSLGPDIRVNCISPGWIDVSEWKKRSLRRSAGLRQEDHAQHPAGRVGRPEDIASLALFLADPSNGFITGADIVADGGMVRKMIYIE